MHGTFSRPMKILASVITVAVLVAGILAWSTWRKKSHCRGTPAGASPTVEKNSSRRNARKPLRLPQIS